MYAETCHYIPPSSEVHRELPKIPWYYRVCSQKCSMMSFTMTMLLLLLYLVTHFPIQLYDSWSDMSSLVIRVSDKSMTQCSYRPTFTFNLLFGLPSSSKQWVHHCQITFTVCPHFHVGKVLTSIFPGSKKGVPKRCWHHLWVCWWCNVWSMLECTSNLWMTGCDWDDFSGNLSKEKNNRFLRLMW